MYQLVWVARGLRTGSFSTVCRRAGRSHRLGGQHVASTPERETEGLDQLYH